jgi:hypothetical protein
MKIHGHPQKTDYASPAEWPTASFQSHWKQPAGTLMVIPNVPDYMQNASHTHVDPTFPWYAENDGTPFQVNFTLKLFHTPGKISRVDTLNCRDVVWDATGSATPPDLTGDPMGLKQFTGHFTVDITLPGDNKAPKKGWTGIRFGVQTLFDNGDSTETIAQLPLFSVIDPIAEEVWDYHMVAVHANAGSNNPLQVPPTQWGVVFVQIPDYIPIAPFSQEWAIKAGMDSYGGTTLPAALYEHRHTVDIHNGIPGTLDDTAMMTQTGGLSEVVVFNPAVLGAGTHNNVLIFNQPDRIQQLTTLLALNITIDPNAPPIVLPPVPPPMPMPTQIAVPNVVGQTKDSAAMNLTAVGLILGMVSSAASSMVPVGEVINSDPAVGSMVNVGSMVGLTISTGPTMPPTPPAEVWQVMTKPPIFMQLFINGVATDRFKICDPAESMTDPNNCPEIVTIPPTPPKMM